MRKWIPACVLLIAVVAAMAQPADLVLSFTVPGDRVQDLVDAYAYVFDYDRAKEEGETKQQFAKRMAREQIKAVYARYRAKQIKDAAAAQIVPIEVQ